MKEQTKPKKTFIWRIMCNNCHKILDLDYTKNLCKMIRKEGYDEGKNSWKYADSYLKGVEQGKSSAIKEVLEKIDELDKELCKEAYKRKLSIDNVCLDRIPLNQIHNAIEGLKAKLQEKTA